MPEESSKNSISMKLRRYQTNDDPQMLRHDRKVKLIETQILSESKFGSENEKLQEPQGNILTEEEEKWNHQAARLDLHTKISVMREVSKAIDSLTSVGLISAI